jgi:hypothetical protein
MSIVITTKKILSLETPILNVSHDEDDVWQFLGDGREELNEDDAQVVDLDEIMRFDPTLLELIDLPKGSKAFRNNVGSQWIILNCN